MRGQGGTGPRVLGSLPSAPAGRLLLLLLPGGQPPRRRGPDRADVPSGLPALRAGGRREQWEAAATVADPHRAQSGRESVSRPGAAPADADRGHDDALGRAYDGGPRGGPARAPADPRAPRHPP